MRMRWAGHVARMGEQRIVYRVLVGKPQGKSPLGRPRRIWEDGIRMDLRLAGGVEWIQLAQDRGRWRTVLMRWWTFGFWSRGVRYASMFGDIRCVGNIYCRDVVVIPWSCYSWAFPFWEHVIVTYFREGGYIYHWSRRSENILLSIGSCPQFYRLPLINFPTPTHRLSSAKHPEAKVAEVT
jgi:hypothetical protein